MISEARREASRRNGCCSRGPTTSEGKASSSRNAVRHGPSRPAGLDPILAGRGSPRWRAPSQGRMPGCSGSPWPSRVYAVLVRHPARCGRLTTIPPNEPDAAQPGVHDLGQTNPSCCRHAGIAQNVLSSDIRN
jgi:hypothetical protein